MDENMIQEALDQLRLDRRDGIAPDEALSDAALNYSLPLSALRNRYRLRFQQDIEEAPPPIQPIVLPTIRNSRMKEARRIAHQFQKRQRNLDPEFYHLNGTIAKIGRDEFVFAGLYLRSRYVMTVFVEDYHLDNGETLPGPLLMRQPHSYLSYFTQQQSDSD